LEKGHGLRWSCVRPNKPQVDEYVLSRKIEVSQLDLQIVGKNEERYNEKQIIYGRTLNGGSREPN
jgi:hypothetical protein